MTGEFAEDFIHRQTLANAVRFTTVDLSELETKIVNAGGRALEIEKRIFGELRDAVLAVQAAVSDCARALAEIDVAAAAEETRRGRRGARCARAARPELPRHTILATM